MWNSVKQAKKIWWDGSTWRYLPFSQIKENIIILKDWSARVVLKCSTINFLLKSTQEQDSIIMSYQRFLNSINFPLQVMIRSKKLDIDTYLWKLNKLAVEQKNWLLQNQTYEYVEYLKKLIEVAQIMKKEFYIIIPFDFEQDNSVRDTSIWWTFSKFWSSINQADDVLKIRAQIQSFTKIKKWLVTRTHQVKTALEEMWVKGTELEKWELVRFLADYYNPSLDNFETMKKDVEDYDLI